MPDDYEIVIQPSRSWFHIDWQGLLDYRDLLFLLVWRDFVAKYKQTILGPLWFIIQPLLTTVVFTIIFDRFAKISTDELPPFLFYLCGLVIWSYFANSLEHSSVSFIENAQLFSKVYFPRIVVPLSYVISNLISFGIQLTLFLGFYIYFKLFTQAGSNIIPSLRIFILPLLVFQTAALALGVGLWLAAMTAKYRDLRFAMTFLIQLWFYATPVIYPVSAIPERFKIFLFINPMAAIADLFRYAFFRIPPLPPVYILSSISVTIFVLATGMLVFNKAERTFIDTI